MFSSSRFTNIVVKWPGSTHHSFILYNLKLNSIIYLNLLFNTPKDLSTAFLVSQWKLLFRCSCKLAEFINGVINHFFNGYPTNDICWFGLVLWFSMPLSTIFQLFRGGQFY
jgi:hypothetical protein